MTDQATTTTEGVPVSQSAAPAATDAALGGKTQSLMTERQEGTSAEGAVSLSEAEAEAGASSPAGAPECYAFEPPAGGQIDAQILGCFEGVARELNMTQESAQRMLDVLTPALAEKQARVVEEARSQWAEGARGDREFGGARLDESLVVARRALEAFGTPALRELLEQSGLGNHPELIRAFYRAGRAISEDSLVRGGGGAGSSAESAAQRMYPGMNP
jgi:hypothetical protein